MKFRIEIWTIEQIIDSYADGELDLNPPYQRRFIWALRDQQTLIDSVLRGIAIPNLFLYETNNGIFEMVDGQQRTRTILGFYEKKFKTFEGRLYNEEVHGKNFLNYEIPVTVIERLDEDESIDAFYALVNNTGVHLNRPELLKAEFFDTRFLALVTELADTSEFQSLDIFTDASTKRMNDIDFVSELVTFLIEGNTDKKIKVDRAFENDINTTEYRSLKQNFKSVIRVIQIFNSRFPIRKTRYKQRNDFYTIFGFVYNNIDLQEQTLLYFYSVLLKFNDHINPSNEHCEPFQEYAFHCVSQSNSKKARDERSHILNELFLNNKEKPNRIQKAVNKYFGLTESDMIEIEGNLTFDVEKLP
jgi:hypothetical protein